MKRTQRVGAIIKTLIDAPCRLYSLQYFCDTFGAAKSSISEDISLADASVRTTGTGYIETIPGAKGGVRFVPDITEEALHLFTGRALHPSERQQQNPRRRLSLYFGYYVRYTFNSQACFSLHKEIQRPRRRLCRNGGDKGNSFGNHGCPSAESSFNHYPARSQNIRRLNGKYQLFFRFL